MSDTVRNIRLAVSPLSWVNEVLHDLGAGTTPGQVLGEAAQAGFEGVETSRIFPHEAEPLRMLLDAHGLSLASGWFSGTLAENPVAHDIETVRGHAALLRDCGARVLVYGETAHMAADALDVALFARRPLSGIDIAAYGQRLTAFADHLQATYGLALSFHHHLMMIGETLDEISAIMMATGPSVGLLLDTGHAEAAGFDYADLIAAFGDRINHIHLKDVRRPALDRLHREGGSFNAGVRAGMFTVPGDGDVDFTPLADFLASGGYEGWLVVEAEQDPAKAPPPETVTRAARFVREHVMRGAQ